ncbi:WD40 repeat-like protein [Suillus brevipes Sb2]|nr:WD40 repeat-like protein [Suillus brevipes Sb2]
MTKFWCTKTWQMQGTRKRVASFKGHTKWNWSLAWTLDGTQWDPLTWQQVGHPWEGHTEIINAIAIDPTGTLVASASYDNHVRLWRLSDRQNIGIFQHSSPLRSVTFSVDGRYILSGGWDRKISQWEVPKDAHSKILATTIARDACITGDLPTAEELLSQDIHIDANNYTSYAHRSFVMARKHAWDHALEDAIKSISIRPSSTGYISKGIALCGKGHIREARIAFDIASVFTNQDSKISHFLLLIKAIALFNADQQEEAMLLVKELAVVCPNADILGCRVVETYLHVQLGTKASHHDEAADHFITAVNAGALSSEFIQTYEDLTVVRQNDIARIILVINKCFIQLFCWDLQALCLTAHQKRCQAFFSAGKPDKALEAHNYMMDTINESAKASCLVWSNVFKQECSALCITNGDTALAARDYDRAIDLYSAAITLNSSSSTVFANRSKAKLGKMLWMEALLDAQKVIELDSLSFLGYNLKHAALHELRQQYLTPPEVERAIQWVIDAQLDNAPLRVLDTTTGLLCDREAQISAFKMSTEYKELLSSTIPHPDLDAKRIEEVVRRNLQYAMLSHRWEGKEPLLQDIQGKSVYDSELDSVGGMTKLRSFCKTAHNAGYSWAWSDTCCIDKNINVELQESVNSMFVWYHHSALTIVYLSDVPPSSKSGALTKSAWNTRGWTVQEFIAPDVILFYQSNWTLYLDDRTPNHKESAAIMQELKDTTGIDRLAVVAFRPGMDGVREKLHWASTRVTTRQEDIAYSLFGIFDVRLPVDYGERQDKALGRLLQEIVARSGDITGLDWVGKSSAFNSCLPASIISYEAPPCQLPPLPEDEIQSLVSSLRKTVTVDFASNVYTQLRNMSAPRFATQRLHLPCIAFNVREVRRVRSPAPETQFTYRVKADRLRSLDITTEETLVQFRLARPIAQKFILVHPWDRSLLELPDFVEPSDFGDNSEGEEDHGMSSSSLSHDWSGDYPGAEEVVDQGSRAFRLLGSGEYKRIASDHDIIGQVNDVRDPMDIRTIEIL